MEEEEEEEGCVTRLSVDKDAVEGGTDVGSDLSWSKRWGRGCWQRRQMPVVGVIEVGGSKTISSADETGWKVMVGVDESRW